MLTSKQEEIKQEIINYIYDNTEHKTLNEYKKSTIALTGAAGTGKTYLIKEIVNQIIKDKPVRIIAPTHQALGVIDNQFHALLNQSKVYQLICKELMSKSVGCKIHGKINYKSLIEGNHIDYYRHTIAKIRDTPYAKELLEQFGLDKFPEPIRIRLSTIHSMLGINIDLTQEELDIENLEFSKLKSSDIENGTVIISDESSMLGSKLLKHLFQEGFDSKSKIIFIGDPCQLPPVNEQSNGLFNSINRKVYRLTDIIRTKHLDITKYCNDLREGKYYLPKSSENIRIIPKTQYKFDDNVILAYTNNQVEQWNNKHKLFHHNDLKFKVGDVIRILRPIGDHKNSAMFCIDKIDLNYTANIDTRKLVSEQGGTETMVLKSISNKVECVKIDCTKVTDGEVITESFCIIKNNNDYTKYYNPLSAKLKRASNTLKYRYSRDYNTWILLSEEYHMSPSEYDYKLHGRMASDKTIIAEDLLKFKNMFILYKDLETTIEGNKVLISKDFQLANALTIHKSQGMSIPNVAVDYHNIFGNDSQSLIYTSMSRVVNRLTILV